MHSGWWNGMGRKRNALTLLNTVAFPAITRASEKIAKGVTRKPFFNVRIAKRKS